MTGNMGVSALAASIVKLFRDAAPEAEISFFLGARTEDPQWLTISGRPVRIEVINYRLSPRAKVREHLLWLLLMAALYRIVPVASWKEVILKKNRRLAAIRQSDIVGNISGGDSFSDIYGLGRFLTESATSLIVILLGKNLCLLPQTYGPYKSCLAQHLARLIMKKSGTILARDPESKALVKVMLGGDASPKQVLLCPDVAFALEAAAPRREDISPPLDAGNHRGLIGLNVNGLLYNGGYSRNNMFGLAFDYRAFVHDLAGRLMEDTYCELLLIPHTYGPPSDVESDPQACREVYRSLKKYAGRVHLLEGEHDPHVVKGVIGLCTFFIGSRMHSCIAALSQGIPAMAVAYSRKFKGVFDTAGMGHMVVDARAEDAEAAIRKILSGYERREIERSNLQTNVSGMKNDLRDAFAGILGRAAA
jgi:polysaccharide pyruvyl transferase WcaK-like protein